MGGMVSFQLGHWIKKDLLNFVTSVGVRKTLWATHEVSISRPWDSVLQLFCELSHYDKNNCTNNDDGDVYGDRVNDNAISIMIMLTINGILI